MVLQICENEKYPHYLAPCQNSTNVEVGMIEF